MANRKLTARLNACLTVLVMPSQTYADSAIISCLQVQIGRPAAGFGKNTIVGSANCTPFARVGLEKCCLARGKKVVDGYTLAPEFIPSLRRRNPRTSVGGQMGLTHERYAASDPVSEGNVL